MKTAKLCFALLLILTMLLLPVSANAELQPGVTYSQGAILYQYDNGGITIVGYVGDEGEETVVVPNFLAGYPVSTIAAGAFADAEYLRTIYLPDTIMTIEAGAIPTDIGVVRDYNLQNGGSDDVSGLPVPTQPVGEIIYQNEEIGVTVVDETFLYPEEVFEDEPAHPPEATPEPSPEPTPAPTETPEPTPEATEAPAEEAAEKSGGAIGWIIGAAVLVCGGAAVVLLRKKGGKA